MRSYDVVAEARAPGAIGEFSRWRYNGIIASSDEGAMRRAFDMVRDDGFETRGAWVIVSRGPLTPEELDDDAHLSKRRPVPAPHWVNPWKDAVPVPLEELVLCAEGLGRKITDLQSGATYELTPERMLEHWGQRGARLDAYILPGPVYGHCIGVKYGAKDWEYLSPLENQGKTALLLAKYQTKEDR